MTPKPQPFTHPKTARLPERKAVTIVAGFRCSDGLVICADTEHNAGLSKFQRRKIISYQDAECDVRFAGAGHSDYIDMMIEKMGTALRGTGKTMQGIKDAFEEVALDVHSKHIQPFFSMQDESRPQICLLVAVRMSSGDLGLLKVAHTTISAIQDYDCLGTGEHLARSLIDWLYSPEIPTRLMRIVAINIVQQTKRYVSGVGGTTNVASLTKEPQRRSVALYDDSQFFFGIQYALRPILLGCLDKEVTDEYFAKMQGRLMRLLDDVRDATKKQQDLETKIFKPSILEEAET